MCAAPDCSRLHKYGLQTIGLDLSNSACSQWPLWTLAAGLTKKHCAINTHLPQAEQLRGDLIRAQFQTGLFLQLPESCIQQLVLDTHTEINETWYRSFINWFRILFYLFNMLILLQRITYKNKIIKLIMYTTQGLGANNGFWRKLQ